MSLAPPFLRLQFMQQLQKSRKARIWICRCDEVSELPLVREIEEDISADSTTKPYHPGTQVIHLSRNILPVHPISAYDRALPVSNCEVPEKSIPKGVLPYKEISPTPSIVAVKKYTKKAITNQLVYRHVWDERKALSHFTSLNLRGCVRLCGTFQDEKYVYFVMQLLSGGRLHQHIKETRGFDAYTMRIYVAEIAMALGKIHSIGYVYRDLNAANIVFDEDGYLSLIDFGFCKQIAATGNFIMGENCNYLAESETISDFKTENKLNRTFSFCGTLHAMSPEMLVMAPTNTDHVEDSKTIRKFSFDRFLRSKHPKSRDSISPMHYKSASVERSQESGYSSSTSARGVNLSPSRSVGGNITPVRSDSQSTAASLLRSAQSLFKFNKDGTTHISSQSSATKSIEVTESSENGHSFVTDWWSLGVLIYEMTCACAPFGYYDLDLHPKLTIRELAAKSPEALLYNPSKMPDEDTKDLIAKLLCVDETQRLGCDGDAAQVLQHPFFKDIDLQKIFDEDYRPTFSNSFIMTLGNLDESGRRLVDEPNTKHNDDNDPFRDF